MCTNPHQQDLNPSHFEGSEEEKITASEVEHGFLPHIQGMKFFDPHMHMSSRTTDDYQALADAGVVALIEPAFWLGQPRTGLASFQDYFASLVGWERFRSSQFGIKHYCTIGLNSREANNEALAEQVMEILPLFLQKEGGPWGEVFTDKIEATKVRNPFEDIKNVDSAIQATLIVRQQGR